MPSIDILNPWSRDYHECQRFGQIRSKFAKVAIVAIVILVALLTLGLGITPTFRALVQWKLRSEESKEILSNVVSGPLKPIPPRQSESPAASPLNIVVEEKEHSATAMSTFGDAGFESDSDEE